MGLVAIVLIRGLFNMLKGGDRQHVQQADAAACPAAGGRRRPDHADAVADRRRAPPDRSCRGDMVKLNKIYTRTGDDGTTGLRPARAG